MSLFAAIGGIAVGAVLGSVATLLLVEDKKAEVATASLEEGFRTFIEHHTDIDRDSERADEYWRDTVRQKKSEHATKRYARRRRMEK